MTHTILTLNSGSASLAFALYAARADGPLLLEGDVKRVRLDGGHVSVRDAEGRALLGEDRDVPDFDEAFQMVFDVLGEEGYREDVQIASHRVVHGGPGRFDPQVADDGLLESLRALVPMAPKHLPQAIRGLEMARQDCPEATHLVCFDTAFHRDLPKPAQMLPLPRRYWERGLRRVGFHGLSYESIMEKLKQRYGREVAESRLAVAHLGGGASMVGLKGGRPLETTMGLTPAGGLVMSTRSGDLDPGTLAYLMHKENLTAEDVSRLVSEESGLLGVSERSGGLRDLLQVQDEDNRAAEAVELFCHHARKHLGALCAVLGGLDTLVFTGSVGTDAAEVRRRICEAFGFLGLRLDPERNAAGEETISCDDSAVMVLVLESDEERVLAQHARDYLEMS